MQTNISVTDTLVVGGELLPPLPAASSWERSPGQTVLRFASDRFCAWDYQRRVPAVTFFQVWNSHFQMQNLVAGRDPYVFPIRASGVLSLFRLMKRSPLDVPLLKLSMRMRLHPTKDPVRTALAMESGQIYQDRTDEDADAGVRRRTVGHSRRWLPPAGGSGAASEHAVPPLWEQLREFRMPGRVYFKAGVNIAMPWLHFWESEASKEARRFNTLVLSPQSSTWWGLEWDYLQRLEVNVLERTARGKTQRRNILPRSFVFLHASWVPPRDGTRPHLVAGVQHKLLLPRPRLERHQTAEKRRVTRLRFGDGHIPLTIRLGVNFSYGSLYATPVAQGTYM
ncbi:hypothetical protein CDCA_CDCA12G3386 [Cyanidium caldarium]|uniref:Uncharacterized protein n=1 Tax=Cyanidium caldarium TaxID=2771 RepID=A0AAV9IZ21_CYACA|nr:hypothetical protein CDCA_CDCA12G3386 [Cyanidium caldarium]